MVSSSPATHADFALPPRLRLGASIGSGGMGEVFAAEHDEHGSVVVKVMHDHLDKNQGERLRLEGEALARVRSPHVVRILDWGVASGRPFLVMERLEGSGLDTVLEDRGALPVPEAAKIAGDVLRGLAVVHDNKLVHRDVKPANVFACPDRAVLLDFGVVKLLERVTGVQQLMNPTRAGSTVGTPRFMSPEQAQAKPIDGRADLYSVGVLLFRMLTGQHLFSYDTLSRQLIAHVKEPPRAPSQLEPKVSAALDEVVLRALAKRPEDRFATADAFREALEAALDREEASSLPSTATVVMDEAWSQELEASLAAEPATRVEPAAPAAKPPPRTQPMASPVTHPLPVYPAPPVLAPTQPMGVPALTDAQLYGAPTPSPSSKKSWLVLGLAAVAAFVLAMIAAEILLGGQP